MQRADAIIKRFDKSKKIIGAEIGVYKGSLSRELLKELPELTLYMIDRWKSYSRKEFKQNLKTLMSKREQDTFDVAYKKAQGIAKKFPKRAKIKKCASPRAAKLFKKRFFDFVFIDANHSKKAVKADVQAWLPKVKKGGYICGHDYHRRTVLTVVQDMFDIKNIEVDEDNTWFVKVA